MGNGEAPASSRPAVRATPAPPGQVVIFEKSTGLPRVNSDPEPSTDESAATLAMLRPKRPADSADATGPNGTRLVDVGQARAAMPPSQHALVVTGPASVPSSPSVPSTAPVASSELPRTYDDSPSTQASEARTHLYRPPAALPALPHANPSGPGNAPPVNRSETAVEPKRAVPLPVILLGFLVVGFLAVAGLMMLLGR